MDRTRYIEFYKDVIANNQLITETKSYQIVIHEPYNHLLQSIKNQTGLTISQIITICFQDRWLKYYANSRIRNKVIINKGPR